MQEETKAKAAAAARPAPLPPMPAAAAKAADALIDRVLQPAPQQEEVKTSGKEAKPSPRAPAPAASAPAAAAAKDDAEAAGAAGMADVTQSELAGLTKIASGSGALNLAFCLMTTQPSTLMCRCVRVVQARLRLPRPSPRTKTRTSR